MRTESQGNGYVFTVVHGHPMADSRGRVLLHRYVMSLHIGRVLEKNEVVHHINGDRLDNEIENLKILSPGEHAVLHRPPKYIDLQCDQCGNGFRRRPGRINGKLHFCSKVCSGRYYSQALPRGAGLSKPITHGQTGYNRGCRCDACKLGHAQAAKRRRDRKKKNEARA